MAGVGVPSSLARRWEACGGGVESGAIAKERTFNNAVAHNAMENNVVMQQSCRGAHPAPSDILGASHISEGSIFQTPTASLNADTSKRPILIEQFMQLLGHDAIALGIEVDGIGFVF